MEDITYLHLREKIDELTPKERKELLDKMIDNWIELRPNEIKYLSKEQNKRYTNKEFQTKRWITPNEWKESDETQRQLYVYNGQRAAITPEVFNAMDKEWRGNFILSWGVLSGKFLTKDWFEMLTNAEKKFYVNKKLMKTSQFYPWEFPYFDDDNIYKLIDQHIRDNVSFLPEALKNFKPKWIKYYEKNLGKNKVRSIVKECLNEYFQTMDAEVDVDRVSDEEAVDNVCNDFQSDAYGGTCTLKYSPEDTRHSIERRTRIYNNQQQEVKDEEIQDLVDRGLNVVVQDMLVDKIDIGDKIHLFNTRNKLNIIAQLQRKTIGRTNKLIFKLVTIMKTPKFYRSHDCVETVVVTRDKAYSQKKWN